MDEERAQTACRLCLKDQAVDVDMFESKNGFLSIKEILDEVFHIQIFKIDDLSSNVCRSCAKQARECYMFQEEIIKNQSLLQSWVGDRDAKVVVPDVQPTIVRVESEPVDHEEVIVENFDFSFSEGEEEEADEDFVEEIPEDDEVLEVGDEEFVEPILTSPQRSSTRPPIIKVVKPPPSYIHCDICARPFTSESRLAEHRDSHLSAAERDVRYTCDFCGVHYHTSSSLTKHRRMHMIRKTVPCPKCGKQVLDLSRHDRTIHRKERGGQCTVCGKTYIDLITHKKIHTERTPTFKCQYCDKTFMKGWVMRIHEETHTGIKYDCDYCPHKSTRKHNLRNHIKKQHPKEFQELQRQRQEEQKMEKIVFGK